MRRCPLRGFARHSSPVSSPYAELGAAAAWLAAPFAWPRRLAMSSARAHGRADGYDRRRVGGASQAARSVRGWAFERLDTLRAS